MKNRELMSSGNPFKTVIIFSIPSILAMIVNSIYNIVDKMFIGNFVSDVALGGLQVVNPLTFFSFFAVVMFGIGSGSYASNKLGEHNDDEANKIFNNGFSVSTAFMFALSLLFMILRKPLLRLCGADELNYEYAYSYYTVLIFGFVFQSMAYFFTMSMRSEGRPVMSMLAQTTGAIVNILLDALFIIVFKWGVFGAAIATVIGHIVNFSIGLSFYLFGKTHFFKFNMYDLNHINWNYIIQISAIGLSSALLNICNGVATIVYNNVIGKYDNALSILAVLTSLDSICVMPCVGIRQGVVPIYGYNYGEKNFKRMYIIFLVGILYTTIYGATMTFIIRRFPGFFINLFLGNATEEVMNEAIRICGFYQIGLSIVGLNMISSGFFQASRHKVEASLLSIMRQCLFLIPSLYIFDSLFNSKGVWYAMPVSDALSGVVGLLLIIASYITYKKTGYISIKDYKESLKYVDSGSNS